MDKKRRILDEILDKIILSHDSKRLVHHLDVHFRIPLILTNGVEWTINRVSKKVEDNSLINMGDLIHSRSFHSTVSDSSSKVLNPPLPTNTKGFYLTMVLRVTSPNLWTSPYSDYQQEVYDLIKTKHDEGMNFVEIGKWLNTKRYKTPRGKVFTQGHVWSMYTKKQSSIRRFSREYDPQVLSTGFDIVNYVPDP